MDPAPELELRDYLRVLRRRKLVVVAAVVVAVGAALGMSQLETPRYAATASLLLQPRSTETLFDPRTGTFGDRERAVQTEIEVLKSTPVRDAVRERLGVTGSVSARPAGRTDIVNVRVESPVPKRSADLANAYAQAYIDFRRNQQVEDLFGAATQIQKKLAELQRQIDTVSGPQKDEITKVQALFREELDKLQVSAELKTGGAQIVTPASVPSEPFSPRPLRNSVLAAVLGLFLGVGVAFLLEYLDDTIKTKDDLERAAPGVTTLGLIPRVSGWRQKDEAKLVSVTDPNSPPAEAYRALRTGVQFAGLDHPVRIVQVTSPNAREGKTTTLANLGVALASAGVRVMVVCCDLRRPRIHEFFGLTNDVGLTSVLLGEATLVEACQKVPDVDRLLVLASGPLPPNPSELLSSRRASEVLKSLAGDQIMVLVDSPPVLPVTDAMVISKWVDATLLVCAPGETTRKEVTRAVEVLRQVKAPLVGTVLNGTTPETSYGYAYRYYSQSPNGAANGNGRQDGRHRGRRHADETSGTP